MSLAELVYNATIGFLKSEVFGLMTQMRRAAVSVPSNIAEGHGIGTDKQFIVALCHARGSLYKLHTQIELSQRLGYPQTKDGTQLTEECTNVARMLNALLRKLRV